MAILLQIVRNSVATKKHMSKVTEGCSLPLHFNGFVLCADEIELQHSPFPGKPRAFDYLLCPGSGEFDLCLRGVGKIESEVSGFK